MIKTNPSRRYHYGIVIIIIKIAFGICSIGHLFSLSANAVESIRWLGVHKEQEVLWNSTKICRRIREQYDLTQHQVKMCRKFTDIMPHVHQAANLTVQTCETLFRYHKWNCSSIEHSPNFLPDLTQGTKEQALVYALTSAALTYTVARGCATARISNCGCSNHPDDPPNGNFKWGGCGDNIIFAYRFSRLFMEGSKRNSNQAERPKDSKGVKMATSKQQRSVKDITSEHSNELMDAINSHNGKIGRTLVKNSMMDHCKCHGVSGSCSVRTCWKGLPMAFIDIANKLITTYYKALKFYWLDDPKSVSSVKDTSLAYIAESPDYCKQNISIGSYGTSGRTCNATAAADEHSNCNELCCGRGFTVNSVKTTEWCYCKFVQCCRVVCDTCSIVKNISLCN